MAEWRDLMGLGRLEELELSQNSRERPGPCTCWKTQDIETPFVYAAHGQVYNGKRQSPNSSRLFRIANLSFKC